jgi:hypothetical protein
MHPLFSARTARQLFGYGVATSVIGVVILVCAICSPAEDARFLLALFVSMQLVGLLLVFQFRDFTLQAAKEKQRRARDIDLATSAELELFKKITSQVDAREITLSDYAVSVRRLSSSGMNVSQTHHFKHFNPLTINT